MASYSSGLHKAVGFCTFSHPGPHIWNNLPQDIRHSATLSSFKSKLRTFLCTVSVCVCMRVHACVCACVCVWLCLNPCWCLHRVLITFSISVYTMYVILCLFSTLSRRVGTIQIPIIIITNTRCLPLSNLFFQPMDPFFNFLIRGLSEQEKPTRRH